MCDQKNKKCCHVCKREVNHSQYCSVPKKLTLLEKVIIGFIVFANMLFLFASVSHAQRAITPIYVEDPYSLTMWLRGNFIYEREPLLANGKRQDHWQTPSELLSTHKGDCEDFAVLTSKVFTELLVWNNIIVIQFGDRTTAHAITVFKEVNGTLSYFSNQYYRKVNAESIEKLLNKEYPDWSFAQVTNNYGQVRQNIYKYIEQQPDEVLYQGQTIDEVINTLNILNERVNQLEQEREVE